MPFALFSLLCAALLVAIWSLTGGLGFTLDDAYIHLSLAENLAAGHYGVNPGEHASVSSSPLWPVVLVPFVWLDAVATCSRCGRRSRYSS